MLIVYLIILKYKLVKMSIKMSTPKSDLLFKTASFKRNIKAVLLSTIVGLTAFSNLQAKPVTLKSDASYEQALEEMAAKNAKKPRSPSKLTDKDQLTMKEFNQHLLDTMPAPGLAVGQKAPDFTLTNAFGKKVNLYSELKKGPVILVFYRGSWCPYCNLHLHVLNKAQPEFAKFDAQVIAVSPQMPDRSKEQIEKDGYPFEVLSDSQSDVMKDYQLFFELPQELVEVYKKFNLSLESYNGIGRNVLPVPGSFVIDKSGKVIAMQAQVDYKARMEPADILTALEKL